MSRKLKALLVATLCSTALIVMPTIGRPGSAANDLFGTTPAFAGNGNGNGHGNGGGHGNSGNHGGGGGNHGKSFDAGTSMKTAHARGGKSGSSHGKGFGVAQSFVDTVGKGVGKASSSVQSMFDGVFGRGRSKGSEMAGIQTTPEDVPVPTGRPEKSPSIHSQLGRLSSLGRSEQAYVHAQDPMMVEMRQYIQDYGTYQDGTGTMTEQDLQGELATIVSQFGKASASTTTTTTTIDPATGKATSTATTTIDPAVASWIGDTLGDPAVEGSKFSDIRGMLDDQAASDATTIDTTTTSSTATDPATEDPAPAD